MASNCLGSELGILFLMTMHMNWLEKHFMELFRKQINHRNRTMVVTIFHPRSSWRFRFSIIIDILQESSYRWQPYKYTVTYPLLRPPFTSICKLSINSAKYCDMHRDKGRGWRGNKTILQCPKNYISTLNHVSSWQKCLA